jgi:hypothetical protein
MKRIIIIGEGQTEQSFCKDVLQPHFSKSQIYLANPVIKKNSGGIVNWEALKYQIETHLLQDQKAFVTTLIDYYGIHSHHDFPEWNEAQKIPDKTKRMCRLENAMKENLQFDLQDRFIPYIQLHEFEGLLFSEIEVFDNNFEWNEFKDYNYLVETIQLNPNPEMINDNSETAPSKRLARILKGYSSEKKNQKVLYGSLLAQEIGLSKIRAKCPRFNDWITKLESIDEIG